MYNVLNNLVGVEVIFSALKLLWFVYRLRNAIGCNYSVSKYSPPYPHGPPYSIKLFFRFIKTIL